MNKWLMNNYVKFHMFLLHSTDSSQMSMQLIEFNGSTGMIDYGHNDK